MHVDSAGAAPQNGLQGLIDRLTRWTQIQNKATISYIPAQTPQGESFETQVARARFSGENPDMPHMPQAGKAFGIADMIDVINPLQHIPLVNVAYRHLTGDDIHPASNILGGAVFGGPLGAAGGVISAVVQAETGGGIEQALLNRGRGEALHFKNAAARYADADMYISSASRGYNT